jgi:hypothetical protein
MDYAVPAGAKALIDFAGLRGPEGPLFHGRACISFLSFFATAEACVKLSIFVVNGLRVCAS